MKNLARQKWCFLFSSKKHLLLKWQHVGQGVLCAFILGSIKFYFIAWEKECQSSDLVKGGDKSLKKDILWAPVLVKLCACIAPHPCSHLRIQESTLLPQFLLQRQFMYFMQSRMNARAITYCSMAGKTFLGKGDWELWDRFSHCPWGAVSTEILGKMEKAQLSPFFQACV